MELGNISLYNTWHTVIFEHVRAIKKRERNCIELADVTGSLPTLAGICVRNVSSGIKVLLLAECVSIHHSAERSQHAMERTWRDKTLEQLSAFVR